MPGDDWEDDYVPDDLVAGSGDEIDGPFIPLEDEEEKVFASDDDVNSHGDAAPTKQVQVQEQESAAKKAKKRKQQRTKNNERKAKASSLSLPYHFLSYHNFD